MSKRVNVRLLFLIVLESILTRNLNGFEWILDKKKGIFRSLSNPYDAFAS